MVWIPQDITPTELEVLRTLWRKGPSTIRELTDVLYPDGTQSHYATVQSLLDRLTKKSCVSREKHGRVNVFAATVSRSDLVGRRLRELADHLCDGSMAPLLSHLVDRSSLSAEELAALDKLVEHLDTTHGSGNPDEGEA